MTVNLDNFLTDEGETCNGEWVIQKDVANNIEEA